jgi:hypothetical protein
MIEAFKWRIVLTQYIKGKYKGTVIQQWKSRLQNYQIENCQQIKGLNDKKTIDEQKLQENNIQRFRIK